MISIILAIAIIAVVGGTFGYQEYQSMTYNDLLNKSENNFFQVEDSFNQAEGDGSYDAAIAGIKQSINYTDQSISETAQMIDVAPDNATREYAKIRNDQFKIMKQMEEMYLRMIEDVKTNGIEGAINASRISQTEAESMAKKLFDDQDRLVNLVNNNPGLKQRLTQVLGEQRVKEILDTGEQ